MAQHDGDIANQTFPNFRADVNSALDAVQSLNSGATAPTSTVPYMLWADTTAGLLKIMNAANSSWITIGTLASTGLGLLSAAEGTLTGGVTLDTNAQVLLDDSITSAGANLPLAFDGDPDTGFFRPAANCIALATAAGERIRWDASGHAYIVQSSTSLPGVGNTTVGGSLYNDGANGMAFVGSRAANSAFYANANANVTVYACYRSGVSVGGLAVTTTTTSLVTSSDKRLKKNIKPLQGAMEILRQTSPSTWTWSHVPGKQTGVGFVAQELHEAIPEAVQVGDADPELKPGDEGFRQWGRDDTKIVPYLVAALLGIDARLSALESLQPVIET